MNERGGEGIASRGFVPELVDVETVEAGGEAGDVADDGGGAVAGLGEGDGTLDAGGAGQDADSLLVLGDDGEDGGAAGGDAGERAGLEGDAAERERGRRKVWGGGSVRCSETLSVRPRANPSRGSRRSRVALIVVVVAERGRAGRSDRRAAIDAGRSRAKMGVDRPRASARTRRPLAPRPRSPRLGVKSAEPPEGTVGLEKMGGRHVPAAGALGAAHVLDAGEGHGEGSGGHGFGVRVERVSSRACVEVRAPIVASPRKG